MSNGMLLKIKTSLKEGTIFSHTNTDVAEDYFGTLDKHDLDPVRIAIVGDIAVTNKTTVSRILTQLLRYFDHKENVHIYTGDRRGTEKIVKLYSEANNLQYSIIKHENLEENERDGKAKLEARNRKLVEIAHVVIIISDKKAKTFDSMYRLAKEEGRLLTRRFVTVNK